MPNKPERDDANVQRAVQPNAPAPELSGNGVDVIAEVRNVLTSLATRPTRDPSTGRFVEGGLAAGTTLERSDIFWTAVAPVKRDLVARVRADLAQDDATETLIGLTEAYAEVRLFRQAMFLRLVDQGGPITTKGKARALYAAYLNALDRELKLAHTLGLERRAASVQSPLEYLEHGEGPA